MKTLEITENAEKMLNLMSTMKCHARSVCISWEIFLRLKRGENIPNICTNFRELIAEIQAKHGQPSPREERDIPNPLKLTSAEGCQLMDKELTAVAKQLHKASGLVYITISEANLLVQMVGSVVSSYPQGGDIIACI